MDDNFVRVDMPDGGALEAVLILGRRTWVNFEYHGRCCCCCCCCCWRNESEVVGDPGSLAEAVSLPLPCGGVVLDLRGGRL